MHFFLSLFSSLLSFLSSFFFLFSHLFYLFFALSGRDRISEMFTSHWHFPVGTTCRFFFIEKYIICNFPWVFQEICRSTSKLLLSTTHRNTHKSWNWRDFNERFFHRYVVLNLIRIRERENRWCDAKMVKNHLAGSCVLVRFYGDLFHYNTRDISRIECN